MNAPLVLSREQVRDVDRWAIEQLGVPGLVLMENAGRGCADVLCELGVRGPVIIGCGKGNNAGDGFVIARHLELRGHAVRVLIWGDPSQLAGDAATNFAILQRTRVPIRVFTDHDAAGLAAELSGADWIVDALLGTGAKGPPRPPLDAVIAQLNGSPARRLAVDLPSGLDCDSGSPSPSTFRADCTCTFVALKPGFLVAAAQPFLGEIRVLDIGVAVPESAPPDETPVAMSKLRTAARIA